MRRLGLLLASLLLLPQAPAQATTWGAYYPPGSHPDEGLWAGRAQIARIFEPGQLGVWSDYPEAQRAYRQGVRRFVFSWKSAPGKQVATFAASLPEDLQNKRVVGVYWHEPENDVADGTLTVKAWKRETIREAKIMRRHGMVSATILMGWTLLPESRRHVERFDLPRGAVDVHAFDAHVKDKDPEQMARLLLREKRRVDMPLGVGETSGPAWKLQIMHDRLRGKMRWGLLFFRPKQPVTQEQVDAWLPPRG